MIGRNRTSFVACVLASVSVIFCESIPIRKTPLHLRSGERREWRSFPATSRGAIAQLAFAAAAENALEYTLVIRQRDVKARWTVTLNDRDLGTLIEDERDMVRFLAVPAGVLRAGSNTLRISGSRARFLDDIEVRDIRIEDVSPASLQRQATAEIAVTGDDGSSMPVRITVVDKQGSLVPVAALRTGVHEAVRTGVVYTSDGRTTIGLPAGEYRIYASRGFEYSAPSARLRLSHGERYSATLQIQHEVRMSGYASADTHVHTLELSGHGDASVDERILTAAGEGLDVIVITEHNRLADYANVVARSALDRWLITMAGTEFTTPIGHFNLFPVSASAPYPDVKEREWRRLMDNIRGMEGVQVVVQNHPRDLHSDYRPFDSMHHLSSIGENLKGRPFLANAMEVVNSGAMASDPLQLVRDWLGLLTRGARIAAVGASDTHTVDFVPIGQARTYIDVTAVPEWRKDSSGVAEQLAAGRNFVSYGLGADLRQAGPVGTEGVPVELTVWGPSWSAAEHVAIYSNGTPVWHRNLRKNRTPGQKFAATVQIPIPRHDTALVAVATGPGIMEPFWEVRKPYQPTSDEWKPMVLGVSRALWIDVDASGRVEAPLQHAERLIKRHGGDSALLAKALTGFDAAVARHVLNLMRLNGQDVQSPAIAAPFLNGPDAMRDAYRQLQAEMQNAGAGALDRRAR